jgi:MoxR-like ATPase
VAATRSGQWCAQGLSPRAALSLLKLARARALLQGRSHVSPEDLQTLWVSAVAHRLVCLPGRSGSAAEQASALLAAVPVP